MPRGVTDQFLTILRHEKRSGIRTILAMGGLSLVAYFMAELTDEAFLGAIVWLALVSIVVGLVAGGVYGWRVTTRYNESIRASWNQWMRMSLSCARVDEVARHVHNEGRAAPVAGVGWGLLFAANATLFVALWVGAAWADAWGAGVTVANGLVLGVLAGRAAWSLEWARRLGRTLHDMLGRGEIGLWGEV